MMNAYADLVYQFGMADFNQASYIFNETNTAVQLIKNQQYYEAFKVFVCVCVCACACVCVCVVTQYLLCICICTCVCICIVSVQYMLTSMIVTDI